MMDKKDVWERVYVCAGLSLLLGYRDTIQYKLVPANLFE